MEVGKVVALDNKPPSRKKIVEMRVVPPPKVEGMPWETAQGARSKQALLEPLSMRERALVCAVGDCLKRFEPKLGALSGEEKQGLLGLLVAFEDATGCPFTEAQW